MERTYRLELRFADGSAYVYEGIIMPKILRLIDLYQDELVEFFATEGA